MFIKVTDIIGGEIRNTNVNRYININHITAIQQVHTGETLIEYINGSCYTNSTPEDLVLEIERIKNEENK